MTTLADTLLENGLAEGGVFAYRAGLLRWGYIKILRLDDRAAHVRYYAKTSKIRPLSPANAIQALGARPAEREYSLGHVAISVDSASQWRVVKILQEAVVEDELEGYRLWQEGGGGVLA